MPLRTQVLTLLILAQVWLSMSQFVFELEVDLDSVTAGDFNCADGIFGNAQCSIYFSVFCLRETREVSLSTSENDCPLGQNTDRMNAYLENQPNTRRITSQSPWPVRAILLWAGIHSRKGGMDFVNIVFRINQCTSDSSFR